MSESTIPGNSDLDPRRGTGQVPDAAAGDRAALAKPPVGTGGGSNFELYSWLFMRISASC